jgi:hypothetical protein
MGYGAMDYIRKKVLLGKIKAIKVGERKHLALAILDIILARVRRERLIIYAEVKVMVL